MNLNFDIGVINDIGNVRVTNEDSVFYASNENMGVFMVADGMGGLDGGEVASGIAADTVKKWWDENQNTAKSATELMTEVSALFFEINKSVLAQSAKKGSRMGTTCVLAIICDGELLIAYIGDSRLYLIRDGKLLQLTEDMSLYAYYEANKDIAPKDNPESNKHILTDFIGQKPNVAFSLKRRDVYDGDIIILCSDGFYNYIDTERVVLNSAQAGESMQITADFWLKAIKKGSAKDNISAVALKYNG
jgi:protein phosphatase